MEEMKISTPSLLKLPTEIIEEIFLYLALRDRKNLRLTCKWFYELCNSDQFCRGENIIWSAALNDVNVQSDLFHIGRSYYNLVIDKKTLTKTLILPCFEKLGTKIRSLIMKDCYCHPGVLESIIMLCDGLRSLCLNLSFKTENIPSNDFIFEPLYITNLHVTNLSLTLPSIKASDYFHRMISIFPNVKRLKIKTDQIDDGEEITEEFVSIFTDIMKSGGNLECLEFKLKTYPSIVEKLSFFEALPHLKDLTVDFAFESLRSQPYKCYPCRSNLVSVNLSGLHVFGSAEMMPLLTNTGLKSLSVDSRSLAFDKESFRKLVASHLNKICFSSTDPISGLPMTILDSALKVNNTVQYFYLKASKNCPQSTEMLFLKYFAELIHLTLGCVSDTILQCIFKYQKNLRSLELQDCQTCSINGFCGSKDDDTGYSINNLQKLQHLSIRCIPSSVLNSDDFKRAFSFPRLKYLFIGCEIGTLSRRYQKIPVCLYENLTELRALRLQDVVMLSPKTISSLFRSLKYLNYLRCDMINSDEKTKTDTMTFINVNCGYLSISASSYKHKLSLGQAYFNKELGRMVILNADMEKKFYTPKIGTGEIDWLDV